MGQAGDKEEARSKAATLATACSALSKPLCRGGRTCVQREAEMRSTVAPAILPVTGLHEMFLETSNTVPFVLPPLFEGFSSQQIRTN